MTVVYASIYWYFYSDCLPLTLSCASSFRETRRGEDCYKERSRVLSSVTPLSHSHFHSLSCSFLSLSLSLAFHPLLPLPQSVYHYFFPIMLSDLCTSFLSSFPQPSTPSLLPFPLPIPHISFTRINGHHTSQHYQLRHYCIAESPLMPLTIFMCSHGPHPATQGLSLIMRTHVLIRLCSAKGVYNLSFFIFFLLVIS